MLTPRPRPSSSNQFEKRQSQWDCDKAAETTCPVDFATVTFCTRKCMCPQASCVSKSVLLGPWVRILSFVITPHWEYHKIITLKPKRLSKCYILGENRQWPDFGFLTQELCVIYWTNFHSPLTTLLPSSHPHTHLEFTQTLQLYVLLGIVYYCLFSLVLGWLKPPCQ